jgi:hypothetical protein
MSKSRIVALWRGELPLARVFWEYTMGWATVLNLVAAGAALAVFVRGGPAWLGLLLHFAAVPLNGVLLVSIWRAAAREGGPLATFARYAGVLWFVVMAIV